MLATPPLADLFETEGSNSEATKCKLKIAEFSGELGAYKRAVEIYEEAAKAAVENNLLKFSARGYLLNAGICYLCYCRWEVMCRGSWRQLAGGGLGRGILTGRTAFIPTRTALSTSAPTSIITQYVISPPPLPLPPSLPSWSQRRRPRH